jgi:hypothetical protein
MSWPVECCVLVRQDASTSTVLVMVWRRRGSRVLKLFLPFHFLALLYNTLTVVPKQCVPQIAVRLYLAVQDYAMCAELILRETS